METNIVEVENFVQQTEERRVSAFTWEVKRYLEQYPNTQYVDVLLTDLAMPELNGLDLIRRLRAASIGLPAIIASGGSAELDTPDAATLGAAVEKAAGRALRTLLAQSTGGSAPAS